MKDIKDPWLVATWPGMGAIAQVAGTYLLQQLGAEEIGEIPAETYFEVHAVDVQNGLTTAGTLPKNRLFAWKHPTGGRDLLLFLGEQQPTSDGYRLCRELVQRAKGLGATRVVTFAAMASPIAPEAEPRVLAAANKPGLLEELRRRGAEIMRDGQIGGLNGLLLAAATEQDLDALCLLGEFPYFASGVPNPKSSAAVLRVFAELAEIQIDLEPILEHGRAVEQSLTEQLQRMQRAAGIQAPAEEASAEFEVLDPDQLDPETEARIEGLFRQARQDRSKALDLKAELDHQGVFKRYEDRFLDLFKQAE